MSPTRFARLSSGTPAWRSATSRITASAVRSSTARASRARFPPFRTVRAPRASMAPTSSIQRGVWDEAGIGDSGFGIRDGAPARCLRNRNQVRRTLMSIYSEEQAKAILDKAIKASKADQCSATLNGQSGGNIRYALNSVSTSGHVSDCDLAVEVAFGKRVGTATTNRFDDASIEAIVRRAEELARLAPENPEFVPAIEKQAYKASGTFIEKTAAVTPAYRAEVAAACIEPCRKEKLVAAGFFSDAQTFSAIANSKGNFGYQKSTGMDFTCTVRTDDAKGSGWVARNLCDVDAFDVKSDIRTAMQKAKG